MNTIWSRHIQGARTLYYSRKLRFDDRFSGYYKALFGLDGERELKVLEIGCGPGALAGALSRWYPHFKITAIDRDSELISFAKEHETGVTFIEADATALPFADGTFDAVISNTVCEHIEPSAFYKEQLRVLKPNGVCLVLSSRRGITVSPDCYALSDFETAFWEKAEQGESVLEKYAVGKFAVNEAEMPVTMEKFGFKDVSTGYVTVNLTPDNPNNTPEFAHAIIDADRYSVLDSVESVEYANSAAFSATEIDEMKRVVNAKYDARIRQYDNREKQWDTSVSVIMVMRGIKK